MRRTLVFLSILFLMACHEFNSDKKSTIAEIKIDRTDLGEPEIMIRNGQIGVLLGKDIRLKEGIMLTKTKVTLTGDNQYYLTGYDSKRSEEYALELIKKGNVFIHKRVHETHSCEVKDVTKRIFKVGENGRIVGCEQGNHSISIGAIQ